MKTLLKMFLFAALIGLIASCNKTGEFFGYDMPELKKSPIVNPAQGLDQERFVTMKDMDFTIHYRIIGKGPIDVVFIPGWTNPLTVYTKQFDFFRDKARCIYIDLPGTGLSDSPSPATPLNPDATGPQYTMELMAEAVHAVVRKEGLQKFVGVGFSMGPIVLGMFERNYPGMICKLVVIDGEFDPWPSGEPARQEFIDLREDTYLFMLSWDEAFKTAVGSSLIPPSLTGEDAEQLKQWGTYFPLFPSDILANTYYHLNAEKASEPPDWLYPKLCFFSVSDPDMAKINLIYPNNTTHTFPGGGHAIQWIFHEEINPLIWEFIKDRPGNKY